MIGFLKIRILDEKTSTKWMLTVQLYKLQSINAGQF